MQTNVNIIRGAISKVTQMLAGMSIEVTQRGDQAFVKYDTRTKKAVRVNIPYLPDGASDELIAATQGFLDHEVAHILFTDSGAGIEAYNESKRLGVTQNIVEDCFIERLMEIRFKGSGVNLGNVRKLVFDTRKRPVIDKMIAQGVSDEIEWFKVLNVTMLRAWAGQEECLNFMNDGDKWQHMPKIVKALSFFEAEIAKCKTSWDNLDLSRKVLDALKDMNNNDEAMDDADPGDSDGEDSQDSGDDSQDKGDQSQEGQGSPDEEQPEGQSSDQDEEDQPDDSSGQDEGEDEGETSEETSEDDEEDQSDDDQNEESNEGQDESDGSDSNDTPDSSGEEDGADSGSDESDEAEEDDADGGADDGDDGSEADSGEADADDGNDGAAQDAELYLDAMEQSDDFESELSAEITKVYQNQADAGQFGSWLVFSREHNDPKPFELSRELMDKDLEDMFNAVNSMIGPMSKQLERLILAKKRSIFEPGKRSGRLHPANLHRLKSGDDRVFRRKYEHRMKDTAVEILVDMSGSMYGHKMTVASYCGYALAQMLQRVNIPCEVFSFTTTDPGRDYGKERREAEARIGRRFSQQDVCNHLLLKGWNERMSPEVAKRFADLAALNHSDKMWQNCDPESVETGARRLAGRKEERKIMIVLSDGHPAFEGDYYAGSTRLKEVVNSVEAAGMEVVGIGIEDRSVEQFYPKSVVLNRAEELPQAIMGEMRRMLLK